MEEVIMSRRSNGISYSTLAFVPHISFVQHPSAIITNIAIPDATIRVEKIFVMSPMPTAQVAHAMITMAKQAKEGTFTFEPNDIWAIQ